MGSVFDLIIVGAGPAGLAAFQTAKSQGLNPAIVDESSSLGGRIYKGIMHADGKNLYGIYGADAEWAVSTIAKLKVDGDGVLTGHTVVNVSQLTNGSWEVTLLADTGMKYFQAPKILIATGAKERPIAFPGWTMPGVMTAGAVQTLMKDSYCVPEGPVALVGSGPLLLLLACQLLDSGVTVSALIDTTPRMNFLRAAPYLVRACGAGSTVWRGLELLRYLRGKLPHYRDVSEFEAHGADHVSSVSFQSRGLRRHMHVPLLVTHTGIVPDIQLSRLLGCHHHWSTLLQAWVPTVDDTGQSSLPGVVIAGDATGCQGAITARLSGHLAALKVARNLDKLTADEYHALAAPYRAKRRRIEKERLFLNHLFAPRPPQWRSLPSNTLICRCEEVDFGTLREMFALGVSDFDHIKAVTRCGMGLCQGRTCAQLVASALAEFTGKTPSGPQQMKIRPPLKPMPFELVTKDVDLIEPSPGDDFVYTSDRS